MMNWYDRNLTSMKIGTIPALVRVHAADLKRAKPGRRIRIQECEGDKWHDVLVDKINADGYIFASR